MLSEAIDLVRHLWEGGLKSFDGDFYEVDRARIYTLPEPLPPIYVAAVGKRSAELAGRKADGFISTAPKPELVQAIISGTSPILRGLDRARPAGR